MDLEERNARRTRAESMVAGLAAQGVVAVATTFVDNSGIARVKTVPLDRLPQLAAWGVGFSTAFDYFRFDDWVAAPPSGEAPGRRPADHPRPRPGGDAGGAAGLGLVARRALVADR